MRATTPISCEMQSNTPWYSWAAGAGAGTLINAVINCIIICSHPGFQEMAKQADEEFGGANGGGPKAGVDPTKMSEEQIAAYLKANPEIAAKALSAVSAASAAQPPAFTGDVSGGAGVGAESGSGVAEWGAVSSKPGHSPAASAAPKSGGFFGGFGGGGKKKAAAAASAAASSTSPKHAESEMTSTGTAAPYQPPAAASFTDVSISGHAGGAADSDNPFAAGGGSGSAAAAPAARPVSPAAASAHAPVPVAARNLPPAPAAHAVPASAPSDLDDNPFAS